MHKPMVGGFVESDGLGVDKYDFYNLETYQSDVLNKGLKQTWRDIIWYVLNGEIKNDFISWNHFAELYEIGLALRDKQAKKESGQYYTPDDVAMVMSDWFESLAGDNVCDVACGTGKLILTYLDTIGERKAIELIRSGKLYLYDSDETALSICKTVLLLKYGKQLEPYIHAIHCDFLSKTINLPDNCKVISNPPLF
ncbi:MAG: N-6 DNA methylase [Candidatus Borkfalkiaceae bacterium]|nr:N-6 DNA methylase [Christensenellaceae bacterium]